MIKTIIALKPSDAIFILLITVCLKKRNIISKMKRSNVTDYAALRVLTPINEAKEALIHVIFNIVQLNQDCT